MVGDSSPAETAGVIWMRSLSEKSALLLMILFVGVSCTKRNDSSSSRKIEAKITGPSYTKLIPGMCDELNESVKKYNWQFSTCKGVEWKADRLSVKGRPLIWAEFGDPTSTNTTLILSMVHPDEVTPLYLGFKLAHWLREHQSEFKDSHVIIAPFVNPDGHFNRPPIRMNSRGVDLNRNFATQDWKSKAVQVWKKQLKSNPRRFPGWEPASEPETSFQVDLIARFQPKKILSVHAPLNLTDYDGPSSLTLDKFPKEYIQECVKLRNRLRARSTGFFPGSLGNYAGQEMGIPTITLELPSADFRKADYFWKKFQPGIHSMIEFIIRDDVAQIDRRKKRSSLPRTNR